MCWRGACYLGRWEDVRCHLIDADETAGDLSQRGHPDTLQMSGNDVLEKVHEEIDGQARPSNGGVNAGEPGVEDSPDVRNLVVHGRGERDDFLRPGVARDHKQFVVKCGGIRER